MKQVYTAEDRLMVYHYKNLLEAQGIDCFVKNDDLRSIIGDLPVQIAWPELWVLDSMMEGWAKELIERSKTEVDTGETWVCKNCGEEHSIQFTECWNCQDIKPESVTSLRHST